MNNTTVTARNAATLALLAACPGVTANDTSTAPRVGDRVEFPGMCCAGASDAAGTVVEVSVGRYGTSYRVALDGGGEEWASTVAPRGSRGAGCRYL